MVAAKTSEHSLKIQVQMSCDSYEQFETKDGGVFFRKCSINKGEMTNIKDTDV